MQFIKDRTILLLQKAAIFLTFQAVVGQLAGPNPPCYAPVDILRLWLLYLSGELLVLHFSDLQNIIHQENRKGLCYLEENHHDLPDYFKNRVGEGGQ